MIRQARNAPVPYKGMGRLGVHQPSRAKGNRERLRGVRSPAAAASKSWWNEIECPYCFEKTLWADHRPGDEVQCLHCRKVFEYPGYGEKVGRKIQHEQAQG